MNETRKQQSCNWGLAIFVAFILALILASAMLGANVEARRFERQGYVLIKGIDGEAVATVTPVFPQWREDK